MITIDSLWNEQEVKARVGRYRDDKPEPEWQAWQLMRLYVARDKRGFVVTITPLDFSWAEYRPKDFMGNTFECEGYYLEVEGLTA